MKTTSPMPSYAWLPQSQDAIWRTLRRASDFAFVRTKNANENFAAHLFRKKMQQVTLWANRN